MNLQSIAWGQTKAINPSSRVLIKRSAGFVVNSAFQQVPQFSTYEAFVDLQALNYEDIRHADLMSIQGMRRKMYITGQVNGLVRYAAQGGDLVNITDATSTWNGTWWKVADVTEYWQGWNSSCITLQNGDPTL